MGVNPRMCSLAKPVVAPWLYSTAREQSCSGAAAGRKGQELRLQCLLRMQLSHQAVCSHSPASDWPCELLLAAVGW